MDDLQKIGRVKRFFDQFFSGQNKREWCIAGGCLRDYLNGVEIKDVDVFVKLSEHSVSPSVYKNITSRLAWNQDVSDMKQLGKEYKEPANSTNLLYVWEMVIDEVLTNVMFVDDGVEHFVREEFDIDFCKILWKDDRLIKTAAYKTDLATKTLTLAKGISTMSPHALRLLDKYPDFTIRGGTASTISATIGAGHTMPSYAAPTAPKPKSLKAWLKERFK